MGTSPFILGSYVVALGLVAWLVGATLVASRRVTKALNKQEERRS